MKRITLHQLRAKLIEATLAVDSRLQALQPGVSNPSVRSCADELEGEINAMQAVIEAIDGNMAYLSILTHSEKV